MTYTDFYTATNGHETARVILPLPPSASEDDKFEMDVYARFMRHLRMVPNSNLDMKVLSAIQFTADAMDCSEAMIAKVLVDLGLRAPRRAFPMAFLEFADRSQRRASWDQGAAPEAVMILDHHWTQIGEACFVSMKRSKYAVQPESVYEGDSAAF